MILEQKLRIYDNLAKYEEFLVDTIKMKIVFLTQSTHNDKLESELSSTINSTVQSLTESLKSLEQIVQSLLVQCKTSDFSSSSETDSATVFVDETSSISDGYNIPPDGFLSRTITLANEMVPYTDYRLNDVGQDLFRSHWIAKSCDNLSKQMSFIWPEPPDAKIDVLPSQILSKHETKPIVDVLQLDKSVYVFNLNPQKRKVSLTEYIDVGKILKRSEKTKRSFTLKVRSPSGRLLTKPVSIFSSENYLFTLAGKYAQFCMWQMQKIRWKVVRLPVNGEAQNGHFMNDRAFVLATDKILILRVNGGNLKISMSAKILVENKI